MANDAGALLRASGDDPRTFLADIASKIEGFLYQCQNNPDWTMIRLTSGFDRVFGHNAAAFIRGRHSFAALIHPEDLPDVTHKVEEAIARDLNWSLRYRMRNAQGVYVPVYESGGAVRHPTTREVMHLDGVILEAKAA